MSDNQLVEIMTEVAKEQSKEIYNDGFKGATQEGGQALETIVGLFNNVILYPLKKANITFKYKLEQFEDDLKENMRKIPEENIIEPSLSVVGPTIEALKYTIDTEDLREMYMNLLTSSMDIDKIKYAHPSYVDIIKQLTSLDANILKQMKSLNKLLRSSRITFAFEDKTYSNAMPRLFAPDLLIEGYDPFLISASIENLCRLGIVINYNADLIGEDYSYCTTHPYVIERYNLYKEHGFNITFEIAHADEALGLTDFGENFVKACME